MLKQLNITEPYINIILKKSKKYLEENFSENQINELLSKIKFLEKEKNINEIIKKWSDIYIEFIKGIHQKEYTYINENLDNFLNINNDIKIILNSS